MKLKFLYPVDFWSGIIIVILAANTPVAAQYTIAFGSCSHQDDAGQLWGDILDQKPDLWIWLGDNIYGDTHNMDSMRAMYAMQKSHPDYQRVLKKIPVIGTWDDHDYGANDGGKFYSKKDESKGELLAFLDVPEDSEVRKHAGVYQSYEFGSSRRKIKVILLDTRYFRDTLMRSKEKGKRYVPSPDGDVLGEQQWAWLEKELKNSDASLNIIGSSIQFLSSEHAFEKWANFPKARKRMLDLIARIKPANTLFISGDRHIAEISRLTLPDVKYPVYDFTSSGLTHTWDQPWEEKNSLRVGDLVIRKNYGLIKVNWTKKGPVVTLQARGNHGALFAEEKIDFTSFK